MVSVAANATGTPEIDAECPTQQQLCDWAMGRLPESALASLERHVGRCAVCQTRLETLDGQADELLSTLRQAGAAPEVDKQEVEVLLSRVGSVSHRRRSNMNSPSGSIPSRRLAANPFGRPIRHFIGAITATEWEPPFIPQFLQLLVFVVLIVTCAALYATVGLSSQIGVSFWELAVDARHRMSECSPVEKAPLTAAAALYAILALVFGLPQVPFWILGWCGDMASSTALGLVTVLFVAALVGLTAFYYWPQIPL